MLIDQNTTRYKMQNVLKTRDDNILITLTTNC